MSDAITAQQFHDAEGVEDWRVLPSGATALYRTQSFAEGVHFISAVAELADEANHHPDVDLRFGSVTIRLTSHDVHSLSERDVALARRISQTARDLGIHADPSSISPTGQVASE